MCPGPFQENAVIRQLARMFNDRGGSLRGPVAGLYTLLLIGNVAAWIWAVAVFRHQPVLLGTALLAYGLGLRHAVDADHIAAIDNVTRKLMQEGKRPVSGGFFFALGHSTVVVLVAAIIAVSASALEGRFEEYRDIGGVVATGVSTLFMFAIAAVNLVVLAGVWRTYRRVKAGGVYQDDDLDILLNQRGLVARLFRPLFRIITRSWHMFPLGFLFGLGFDTATEVAVLGISATQAAHGVSIWSIMVFPALFAAGMTVVDTTDGILMLGAYDWAFVKPMRKLYYNLTITSVSVVVAVVVGSIEGLRLVSGQFALEGPFWSAIGLLNENFNAIGFIILGLFVASWAASMAIYRIKRLDEVDVQILR
jgi:high-affinity nickel-transport protein